MINKLEKAAYISATKKFICLQSCATCRLSAIDPDGKIFFLERYPEVVEFGRAIRECLAASRIIPFEEVRTFFDRTAVQRRYEDWLALLMQKFGYKTRRAVLQKMHLCNVDLRNATITFGPTFHEKLEGWSGELIDKADYVHIPETSTEEEIGQAALLALSRCIGPS